MGKVFKCFRRRTTHFRSETEEKDMEKLRRWIAGKDERVGFRLEDYRH